KWIHHLTHDWSRTDDCHLHNDVIKTHRAQARQARHLRAAFYLEHSNRISLLQRGVNLLVVCRKMREIDFFVIVIADQFDGVFDHRHHAEPEQINFNDAHVGAVFLVPLNDDAARHGRGLEWNDGIELSLANDHAARVLAEMAWHVLYGKAE